MIEDEGVYPLCFIYILYFRFMNSLFLAVTQNMFKIKLMFRTFSLQGSTLPLSIIIVGVGNENFEGLSFNYILIFMIHFNFDLFSRHFNYYIDSI